MSLPNYFNYISFHNDKKVSGDTIELSMTLDRVFEYTPSEISARLNGFNEASLEFISSLPTFLCSEINENDEMYVKFGRITSLTLGLRELEFSFETVTDFGFVRFEGAQRAAECFGAHSFQPYRTHWAIMQGFSRDILHTIRSLKPIAGQADSTVPTGAPIPSAPEILGTASTVEQFLHFVFSVTNEPDVEYFFRGHEKASFALVPTIMRDWDNGAPKFLPNEERMGKELLIAHYDNFQDDQFCFDRLVRMQHYGLPTRLLDLTGNPLVALYFACEKEFSETGQVLIFGIKKDIVKYYDSDTVSCVANLSKLTTSEKDSLDISLDTEAFNLSNSAKQLIHHIKAEKSYFESRIEPKHIGSIMCVKGKRNNIRIKSQHGAFLLFGHGSKMPPEGIEGITVRRVDILEKDAILMRLDGININASTVYPGMEESAEKIRKSYMLPEK